jgi:hypothetical protein
MESSGSFLRLFFLLSDCSTGNKTIRRARTVSADPKRYSFSKLFSTTAATLSDAIWAPMSERFLDPAPSATAMHAAPLIERTATAS